MNEAGGSPPTPNFEALPPPEAGEKGQSKGVEKQGSATESSQGRQAMPQAQALPAIPVVDTPHPALPTDDDVTKPSPSPAATAKLKAGNGDLIEQEWVHKAKAIVSQTKDDPYKQKNEMSKVKADYIQKRFNKPMKTDDTVAA